MAKGKHSTALFEVIHTARRPPKASPTGGMATPQWWFKSKKKAGADTGWSSKPSIFTRWKTARNQAPHLPATVMDHAVNDERPAIEPAPPRPAMDPPRSIEKGAGEIKFKLSYAGAGAAALVLVLLLVIVYLAGARSPQTTLADTAGSSGDSHTGTSSATVSSDGTGFLAAVTSGSGNPAAANHAMTSASPRAIAKSPSPVVAPEKVDRQVGLNYVIAQSYASKEMARKACDFLNQSGVACTVVQGPPGWAVSNWYSVVGTKSFDHVQHNPELEAYKHQVEALGVKFAGNIRFNRFEPNAYKWREAADKQE